MARSPPRQLSASHSIRAPSNSRLHECRASLRHTERTARPQGNVLAANSPSNNVWPLNAATVAASEPQATVHTLRLVVVVLMRGNSSVGASEIPLAGVPLGGDVLGRGS
eukprot:g39595.t1